ncbi:MAG: PAS domain S-box protein, partial [Frankiaceae bacterium]|nr:PAS domain S-box protein [Arenimonas sp.]
MVIKDPIQRRTPAALSPQQQIWDSIPDGLLVIDGAGLVRYANPAVGQMFGLDAASLVGQPVSALQPERFRHAHAHGAARYASTGIRSMDWTPIDAIGLHHDGTEFPLEISLFDLEVAGERMVGGLLRDGSERRRAQSTQVALRKISEAAHAALDLEDLFRQIHSIIGELLPARNFYVALHDHVTDLVSFPYWVDEVDPVPEPRPLAER